MKCSPICRLSKKYSSHNAQYSPSMHIISVDMMIDDSCCLVRWLLLLVVQSVVIVRIQAAERPRFIPFVRMRMFCQVLDTNSGGKSTGSSNMAPLVERRLFWFHGCIVCDRLKRATAGHSFERR